ncbi:MAG: glycosyl hydrolase family 28-related protein, partial [Flavobacterium sp.]
MIIYKALRYNSVFFIVAYVLLFFSCSSKIADVSGNSPWKKMELIVKSIPQTQFLDKNYNIKDYGAVADGLTLNTGAFEKAIKECAENGGGKVIVPNGKYLTGAIHLESNVNLHLEDNAEILFSTNPKDYPI